MAGMAISFKKPPCDEVSGVLASQSKPIMQNGGPSPEILLVCITFPKWLLSICFPYFFILCLHTGKQVL